MEYLSTKEVAAYLRIHEKKVYALVAEGAMPAARVCGKWLFPKHLIDEWVAGHTTFPGSYKVDGLLDDLIVVQGSDDGLFEEACRSYRTAKGIPVVEAQVGSLAGLEAVSAHRAHVAGCHVENDLVAAQSQEGRYLISLFKRQQGLLFVPDAMERPAGLSVLAGGKLRFADRQPGSGTFRLTRRLMRESNVDPDSVRQVGPFHTHLDVALAVRSGAADLGVASYSVARRCGLGFVPLEEEIFKLALPLRLASHPRAAEFVQFVLETLKRASKGGLDGYSFDVCGRLETIGRTQ